MSQLGYMVIAIGISEYELSIYHLVNHAYYKGLLFISVGVIIHTMNDEQDIRRLGGLIRRLPFTYITILIGSLSLMGIPYMTGNYSKEMIIEIAYNNNKIESYIGYILGILSVICTTIYTIKIIRWSLIEIPGSRKVIKGVIEEPVRGMYIPMIILSILSIINGYLIKDMIIGIGNNIYTNSINILPKIKRVEVLENNIIGIITKNIPIIIIIIIILLNLIKRRIEIKNLINKRDRRRVIEYIIKGMEIDIIYNNIIIKNIYRLGKIIGKRIDKGILEIIIAYRLIEKIKERSKKIGSLDNGNIYKLIINIIMGIILLDNLNIIEWIIIIIIGILKENKKEIR